MKLEFPFICPGCGQHGRIALSMDGQIPKERKPKKAPADKVPFFQDVVGHISVSWEKKKGAKFHWEPQFFKTLHSIIRTYQPWGVLSLWDLYLGFNNDWVRTTGYSFPAFVKVLPQLLDMSWKAKADQYRDKMLPPIAPEVTQLMAGMLNGKSQLESA